MSKHAPAPTSLAQAVRASLPGPASASGFTLLETLLVVGGVALLSAGGFVVYQGAALSADVKTEQSNIQSIAQQSDRVYGSLGSYENLTTQGAITSKVPPQSMIVGGTGLMSRWQKPVLLEPTDVGARTNAGLQITYQDVPAKACARLAVAASGGMFDVKVAGETVFNGGKLDVSSAVEKCAAHETAPMIFTYYGGTSGLAGQVLAPIEIPALPPTSAPVVTTVPPVPPPVAPPTAPPAPGCGPVPAAPASGITPAGQACSFFWQAVAAPSCWTSQPLCAPTVAPPPVVTPPASCAGAPSTSVTESRPAMCPFGQITSSGSPLFTQTRDQITSHLCPDPWAPAVTSTAPFTAWGPLATDVCFTSSPCVAPFPTTENETQNAACPPGQVSDGGYGTTNFTQTRKRITRYNCPAPTGPYTTTTDPWMSWSPSLASCAPLAPPMPPCVAPPTSSESGSQTASCPPGQVTSSGASTFSQTRSRWVYHNCPTPTGPVETLFDSWSAYSPLPSAVCTPAPPACTAPASSTAPVTRAATPETQSPPCPAGQIGAHTQARSKTESGTRTTSWACPGPTSGTSDSWSGTFTYGTWTTTSNTCAPPACTVPASSTAPVTRAVTPETQSPSCPAGQTGTHTQTRSKTESGTRTTSWTCPGPTSGTSDSWSGSFTYGGWATTTNTCTPTAAPCTLPTPSTQTNTETRVAVQYPACPPGYTGTITQNRNEARTQNRSASCPAPTGAYTWGAYSAWSAWAATSVWATTSNTCAANCVLPSPSTQTNTETRVATQNPACPSGQSGAITQTRNEQRTQNRSASCPAPTGAYTWGAYSAWSAWAATSSWTTTSNTCTPICGPAPAPGARTLACVAPQTGPGYTQTHGWTATSAPTCWNAAPWGTTGGSCTTPPPPPTGVCTGRPITIGCATYNSSGVRITPIEINDDGPGSGFGDYDYVQCKIGFADTIDAQGYPDMDGLENNHRLKFTGSGMDDWYSTYGYPEDTSVQVTVYAKNADGTQGAKCFGTAKVMFNYNP